MSDQTFRRSAWHLAKGDNQTLYQPVRKNNFQFLVDATGVLANLLRVGDVEGQTSSYITNAQEVLEFSVVKFDVPHFTQESIEVKRGNSKVYFAGVPSFKEGNLVINDFIGADGKSVLMSWQALSYNIDEDTIPSTDKYKANATVNEYLPDGTLIRSWDLTGCWVSGVSEDGWDNTDGGMKQVTATIKFDSAREHRG